MTGKLLRVNEFDLKYGNKERKISVFVCFRDKKYNNQYVIYADNYESGILYYGNAHIKDNKLIIIDIKQDRKAIITSAIEEVLNSNINSFEIISLNDVKSVEIIASNSLNLSSDKLMELDKLTIEKEKVKAEDPLKAKKRNKIILTIFLILIFIILIGGIFVYFNRDKFFGIERAFECITESTSPEVNASVTEIKELSFDRSADLANIDTTIVYVFATKESYDDFKSNNKHFNYMPYDIGEYKYLDEELTMKIFAHNTTKEYRFLPDLDEVISYYNTHDYKCSEVKIETVE